MQYLSFENYESICLDFVIGNLCVLFQFCSWKYEARKKLFSYFVGAFRVKKLCHLLQVFLFSVCCCLVFVFHLLLAIKKGESYKKTIGD